jgi:hypothetical protein
MFTKLSTTHDVITNIEMCSDKKRFNATPTTVTSPFLVNSFPN